MSIAANPPVGDLLQSKNFDNRPLARCRFAESDLLSRANVDRPLPGLRLARLQIVGTDRRIRRRSRHDSDIGVRVIAVAVTTSQRFETTP